MDTKHKSKNNDTFEYDPMNPSGVQCKRIDMRVYRWWLDQMKQDFVNVRAEELFMSAAFSSPVTVEIGKTNKYLPNELITKYFSRKIPGLVKTLREWYYGTGFGALKPVELEDGTFELRPVLPEECQIFMIREDSQTKLRLHWNEDDMPWNQESNNGFNQGFGVGFGFSGGSTKTSKKSKQSSTKGGISKVTIPFDNQIVWFCPDLPDFVDDNTMQYLDIIDRYLCGKQVYNPITLIKWKTCFRSKLVAVFFVSLSHLRLLESQQRIEDYKLDRSVFLENSIPYGEKEYLNYQKFSDIKYDNVLQITQDMEYFLGRSTRKRAVIDDPRIYNIGPTNMFGGFTRSTNPIQATPTSEVRSHWEERMEKEETVELTRKAFDGALKMSRGFFNSAVRNEATGRDVYSSAPNQKIVWEPKPTGKSTDNAAETEHYLTVKCDIYGIPISLAYQNSANVRVQISRQSREDMTRRFQYVAKVFADFLSNVGFRVIFQNLIAEQKKAIKKYEKEELMDNLNSETVEIEIVEVSSLSEDGNGNGDHTNDKKKKPSGSKQRNRNQDILDALDDVETVRIEFCMAADVHVGDLVDLYSLDIPPAYKAIILENVFKKLDIHPLSEHEKLDYSHGKGGFDGGDFEEPSLGGAKKTQKKKPVKPRYDEEEEPKKKKKTREEEDKQNKSTDKEEAKKKSRDGDDDEDGKAQKKRKLKDDKKTSDDTEEGEEKNKKKKKKKKDEE